MTYFLFYNVKYSNWLWLDRIPQMVLTRCFLFPTGSFSIWVLTLLTPPVFLFVYQYHKVELRRTSVIPPLYDQSEYFKIPVVLKSGSNSFFFPFFFVLPLLPSLPYMFASGASGPQVSVCLFPCQFVVSHTGCCGTKVRIDLFIFKTKDVECNSKMNAHI